MTGLVRIQIGRGQLDRILLRDRGRSRDVPQTGQDLAAIDAFMRNRAVPGGPG